MPKVKLQCSWLALFLIPYCTIGGFQSLFLISSEFRSDNKTEILCWECLDKSLPLLRDEDEDSCVAVCGATTPGE